MKPSSLLINDQVVTVEADKLAQEAVLKALGVSREGLYDSLNYGYEVSPKIVNSDHVRAAYLAAVTALQLQRQAEYRAIEGDAAIRARGLLDKTAEESALEFAAGLIGIGYEQAIKIIGIWGKNRVFATANEKERAFALAHHILTSYIQLEEKLVEELEEEEAEEGYWLLVGGENGLVLGKETTWPAVVSRAQELADQKGCVVRAIHCDRPPGGILAWPTMPHNAPVDLRY